MQVRTVPAPPEVIHAQLARLVYVRDGEQGYTRVRSGRGFKYSDLATGRTVKDADTLARIRSLVIPPAWKEVWICGSKDGHLQATGRDERGRKQYIYHADWRRIRDADKYERILEFAALSRASAGRLRAKCANARSAASV